MAQLQKELAELKEEQRDLEDSSVEIIAQLQREKDDLEARLVEPKHSSEQHFEERLEEDSQSPEADLGDAKTQAWTDPSDGEDSDGPQVYTINVTPDAL